MSTPKVNPFPVLKTEHLILRQLLESDAAEIFSLRSDITINKYLDRPRSNTISDALNFIKKINEITRDSPVKYWAISLKDSSELVGTICLFELSDDLQQCEIGYELLIEHQGKGIMQEATEKVIQYAFQTLGIKTINAFSHRDNIGSTSLLNKLTFAKKEFTDTENANLVLYQLSNHASGN